MARPRSTPTKPPRQPNLALPQMVLGNPDLYPDEFKAWLPRFLSQNVNLNVGVYQIPQAEQDTQVGTGGTAPVFVNGWTNFGGGYAPLGYYRDPSRRVHIGGVVKNGVIGSTIFVLPSGYAPTGSLVFVVASGNGVGQPTCGVCIVNPDGSVVASAGDHTYFSLSGISYRQSA